MRRRGRRRLAAHRSAGRSRRVPLHVRRRPSPRGQVPADLFVAALVEQDPARAGVVVEPERQRARLRPATVVAPQWLPAVGSALESAAGHDEAERRRRRRGRRRRRSRRRRARRPDRSLTPPRPSTVHVADARPARRRRPARGGSSWLANAQQLHDAGDEDHEAARDGEQQQGAGAHGSEATDRSIGLERRARRPLETQSMISRRRSPRMRRGRPVLAGTGCGPRGTPAWPSSGGLVVLDRRRRR